MQQKPTMVTTMTSLQRIEARLERTQRTSGELTPRSKYSKGARVKRSFGAEKNFLTDAQTSDNTVRSNENVSLIKFQAMEERIRRLTKQNVELKQSWIEVKANQFYTINEEKVKRVIEQNEELKSQITNLQEINSNLRMENEYLEKQHTAFREKMNQQTSQSKRMTFTFNSNSKEHSKLSRQAMKNFTTSRRQVRAQVMRDSGDDEDGEEVENQEKFNENKFVEKVSGAKVVDDGPNENNKGIILSSKLMKVRSNPNMMVVQPNQPNIKHFNICEDEEVESDKYHHYNKHLHLHQQPQTQRATQVRKHPKQILKNTTTTTETHYRPKYQRDEQDISIQNYGLEEFSLNRQAIIPSSSHNIKSQYEEEKQSATARGMKHTTTTSKTKEIALHAILAQKNSMYKNKNRPQGSEKSGNNSKQKRLRKDSSSMNQLNTCRDAKKEYC